MTKLMEWVLTKTQNTYTALYDPNKKFWKNCEDVGKYRQEQRKLRREERKKIRQLKEMSER